MVSEACLAPSVWTGSLFLTASVWHLTSTLPCCACSLCSNTLDMLCAEWHTGKPRVAPAQCALSGCRPVSRGTAWRAHRWQLRGARALACHQLSCQAACLAVAPAAVDERPACASLRLLAVPPAGSVVAARPRLVAVSSMLPGARLAGQLAAAGAPAKLSARPLCQSQVRPGVISMLHMCWQGCFDELHRCCDPPECVCAGAQRAPSHLKNASTGLIIAARLLLCCSTGQLVKPSH